MNINKKFGIIQFLYYAAFCIMFSFAAVFLNKNGYNDFQIGKVIALSNLVAIISQPLFGYLADHVIPIKVIILANLLFASVMTGMVFLMRLNFSGLLICFALLSFSERSLGTLIDSWISKIQYKDPTINYGLTRGLGSLGAALSSVATGIIIYTLGFGTLFFIHSTMLLMIAFVVVKIDSPMCHNTPAKSHSEESRGSLVKNNRYILLVVTATVLFLGVSAEVTYFPILLQSHGGDSIQLGTALFIMFISELVVMANYKRISTKLSCELLMLISLICYCIKLFLQTIISSVWGLTALQMIQGFTFGLFLPSLIHLINKSCHKNNTATAIALCFSVYNGVGFVIGSYLAGMISENYGLKRAFTVAALFCLMSIFVYLPLLLRGRKIKKSVQQ